MMKPLEPEAKLLESWTDLEAMSLTTGIFLSRSSGQPVKMVMSNIAASRRSRSRSRPARAGSLRCGVRASSKLTTDCSPTFARLTFASDGVLQ